MIDLWKIRAWRLSYYEMFHKEISRRFEAETLQIVSDLESKSVSIRLELKKAVVVIIKSEMNRIEMTNIIMFKCQQKLMSNRYRDRCDATQDK